MIIGQTIYPNFRDKDLLQKAGFPEMPEQFVSKKLLPGEIAELASKIQEISGFDFDSEQDVDEAKN